MASLHHVGKCILRALKLKPKKQKPKYETEEGVDPTIGNEPEQTAQEEDPDDEAGEEPGDEPGDKQAQVELVESAEEEVDLPEAIQPLAGLENVEHLQELEGHLEQLEAQGQLEHIEPHLELVAEHLEEHLEKCHECRRVSMVEYNLPADWHAHHHGSDEDVLEVGTEEFEMPEDKDGSPSRSLEETVETVESDDEDIAIDTDSCARTLVPDIAASFATVAAVAAPAIVEQTVGDTVSATESDLETGSTSANAGDSGWLMKITVDSPQDSDGGSEPENLAIGEVWLVCEDYIATNENEISLQRGQQVEVLDVSPAGHADWCLVRPLVPEPPTNPSEGLVPMATLKQLPNLKVSGSRTSIENEGEGGEGSPNTSSSFSLASNSTSSSSPANKRRSSFRKWLTNPVRKYSQSKMDKQALAAAKEKDKKAAKTFGPFRSLLHTGEDGRRPEEPPLAQQEDLMEEGARRAAEQIDTPQDSSSAATPVTSQPEAPPGGEVNPEDVEVEEEVTVEMPPPMGEIHTQAPPPVKSSEGDAHAKLSSTLSLKSEETLSADLAQEIENMVKHKKLSEQQSGSLDGASGGMDMADSDTLTDMDTEESQRNKHLQKRAYVIKELIDTEMDYVRDLGLIVAGYMSIMKEIQLPEDMVGKDKIVFGNIHQIYEWHQETFLGELERCAHEPERLGGLFIRFEKKLSPMYVKYCENKPKSEYIVAEYIDFFEELRQKLQHRLQLPDLLIKPVQRIMKYQLLLKDILKYTERAGEDTKDLQRATEVMCIVPKAANDMMNIGRLQGFNGVITAQGNLLLQDTLQVLEVSSTTKPADQKFKSRRVFLFEQSIIISEEIERSKKTMHLTSPGYIFKNSVMVNKMSLNEKGNGEPLTFVLNDKTPGSQLKLFIQCPDIEVYQNWISQIRSMIEMQTDFLLALQSPISYQMNQLSMNKELSAPDLSGKPRNSMLRKTQSQPQKQQGGSHTLPANVKLDKHDSQKHLRCKSGPLPTIDTTKKGESGDEKSSCPQSPTSKEEKVKKKLSSSMLSSGTNSGSPKPKRNIMEGLRNFTLRPSKSRSQDSTVLSAASKPIGANEGGVGGSGGDASCATSGSDGCGAPEGCEQYANSAGESQTEAADFLSSSDTKSSSGGATGCTASGTTDTSKRKTSKQNSVDSSDDTSPCDPVYAKVLADYTAVREDEISVTKGETIQILAASHNGNMYLVHREASDVCPAAEGWLPANLLAHKDGDNRKSWHLKIRKPSFTKDKKESISKGGSLDRSHKKNSADNGPDMSPGFVQPLSDITAESGETVIFTCQVCGRPRPTITWRAPNQTVLVAGSHISLAYTDNGIAMLQLHHVTPDQAGEYTCTASNEQGAVTSSCRLIIADKPRPPGQPVVRDQSGTSVHLEWAPPPDQQNAANAAVEGYSVEYTEQGSLMWQALVAYEPSTNYVIDNLTPGATYRFRVSAHNAVGQSNPSKPSDLVTIPSESELSEREESGRVPWKKTFEADYSDNGELARGRFSIVRHVVERTTGRDLAAKCVSRKLVTQEEVETEYNTLQSLQNPHLVQAYDLYQTPTSYVIVQQLLPSGRLFDYICSRTHFDELQAAQYIHQLLDTVQFLHNCRISHLDIKPENLLVEVSNSTACVKLVDFGDARHIYNNYYVHPLVGSPEFAAPELVSGSPVGLLTDIWSVGVVVYVLLSGVSPFLDESLEETCSNILRKDYCFPDEYFAGISQEAKDFISTLLTEDLTHRPTSQMCMAHPWVKKGATPRTSPSHMKPIATARLADFIERRKHQNDTATVTPMKVF